MKNLKKIGIVVLLLAAFGIYAWYDIIGKQQLNGKLLLDNPTSQLLKVTIDNARYEVPPKSFISINLEKGKHNISGIGTFTIAEIPYGVINPTKSKYIIYDIVYSQSDEVTKAFKPYNIDGKEIYAYHEPKLSTDIFIEDLTMGNGGNLDQETNNLRGGFNRFNQNEVQGVLKIFRLPEFFVWYEEQNK